MLIIENNSVYEIDEECLKKRKVPMECHLPVECNQMLEFEQSKALKQKRDAT